MKRFLLAGLASALLFAPLLAQVPAPATPPREAQPSGDAPPAPQPARSALAAWGLTGRDLPVDPAVRFGVLPNGMKYALLRNTTPPGQVMVRFAFDIGSLEEADDQQGLAHFLEHMAFNGSTNVPEGEMVHLLERNGLAFGADTNASTDVDETSYQLDLPRNSPALIDTALMLMRETASELLIAPAAVDRERGVIQSERQTRESFAYRNYLDAEDFEFPGARQTARSPIGLESIIRTAPAQRIRDFYDAYYRPERATLVIVGDIDVDAVEAAVRARFADWTGRGVALPEADPGPFRFDRPAVADIFVHPAINETVSIIRHRAAPLERDNRAQRQRYALEAIGEAIIRRRLSTVALAADAPIIGGVMSETGAWDQLRVVTLYASARDGAWRSAIRVMENEQRRAVEHGFTDAEVAEQVASWRAAYRNAVASAGTRNSASLAGQLLGSADGDSLFTTPLISQNVAEGALARANGATVTAAFRNMVQGFGEPMVRVTIKQPIEGGGAAVLAAYTAATQLAVAPPVERATAAFAYTNFGTPGRVVADDRVADLGIRRVRFANNVMLNIKRTDFEDDRVRILVRVDGGDLLATRAQPLRVALANLVALGGLEAHSADELRSILAGRSVAMAFGSSTDSFDLSGITTPAELLLQAQLYAATIRNPGYRPEAVTLLRRILPQQYAQAEATPGAVIGRLLPAIIADDDPRAVVPPLETMMALDWAETRASMADALASGAIEIGIVGDIEEQAAIDVIAATFGALPTRRATFDPRIAERVRSFASDLSLRTLLHRGERDQAAILTYWPTRDDADLREDLELDLLAAVFQLSLTDDLRERLGRSYSPSASSSLSSDFPGYGILFAGANVDFADIAESEAAIAAIAARLRDAPISEDVLRRARAPIVEQSRAARRTNSYWLNYARVASSEPARLDRSRLAPAMLDAISVADIQRVAQRYLRDDRMLRVRVVSRDAAAGIAAGAAATSAAPSE